jgi:hypothetical protein
MYPRAVIAFALILSVVTATAEQRHYIKKTEVFCDAAHIICLRGSLTYEANSRILKLHARIQKQVVPGTITMLFTGSNRQDMLKRTEIVHAVKGRYSEIVNKSIRPDAPDVSNWQLHSFTFAPHEQ